MRLNRKEHLLLFDEPLSVAEEAAYHSTVESFGENHAYSCLRRVPSYPTKPTVTALQLSRTPSLISLVSTQSPRCSTGSSFSYGKSTPSVKSVPSLASSSASNSTVPSTPQLASLRKFSPSPVRGSTPFSASSLEKTIGSSYMAISDEDLTAFRIQSEAEPARQQEPQKGFRPPRPPIRPIPRKRVLPRESIVVSAQKLNQLVTRPISTVARPISLTMDNRYPSSVSRGKAMSYVPEDTKKALARSLAGRSTLLAGKTAPYRMSIYERILNLEAGFKLTDPDIFDFELPGFDPCMNRVLVGGGKK